jgi:dCMP deaminase
MRPSKLANAMKMASVAAECSHDAETKVGVVLIHGETGAQLSSGFNGFVRGAPDDLLPSTRPFKYEYIIHAEQNLLANCARHGTSTDGCFIVCTMSPCKLCMRLLINAGITKVVAKELYRDFSEILEMKDVQVRSSRDENGFYHITYEPR